MFVFDEGADFSELVFAGGLHGKCVQGELRCGSSKEAFAEVLEDFALHRILAQCGAIDVGTIGFIAYNETLGGHDLKHLEDGGVTGGPVLVESVVNLAHRGWLLLPEDLKEFKFGFGGTGDGGAVCHDG